MPTIGVEAWLSRSQAVTADLANAGLRSGLGEQLKVLRLLQLLEQRGRAPTTPDELLNWIAPIICSRSDQVDVLRGVLTSSFFTSPLPIGIGGSRPGERRFGWDAVLYLFLPGVMLLGLLIFGLIKAYQVFGPRLYELLLSGATFLGRFGELVLPKGSTFDSNVPLATPSSIGATIATAAVATLLWRRLHLAFRHGRVTGPGKAQTIRTDPPEHDTDDPGLLRTARLLNRPQLQRVPALDVPATVRATAANGGQFSPVQLVRRISANWMLIAERAGPEDPTPEFGAHLSVLLTRSGVRHTFYEFHHSPDWVRRDGPHGPQMTLEKALATDRPTRFLMLAEATSVIDERTGAAAEWLHRYDIPPPILLTPNARQTWSVNEAAAAQAGILVLPANSLGLADLALRMQLDDLEPAPIAPGRTGEFDHWQAERFTWLSQTAPEIEERAALIDTIVGLLEPSEIRLLVGIAAFPEVRLDLMATLDRKLHPDDNVHQRRSRLLTLGRLVWLKESVIPEWLRDDLMRILPASEMRTVRETWMDLLANPPGIEEKCTTLEIHLAGDDSGNGIHGDGLFLSFLRGEYDLPAPFRIGGIAALLRAPDRAEWLIGTLGALALAAGLLTDIDPRPYLDQALRAWYDTVARVQALASPFLSRPRAAALSLMPAFAAVVWITTILFGRIHPRRNLPRVIVAIGAALITLMAGWLTEDLDYRNGGTSVWAFGGPLVLAAGVALAFLWPTQLTRETAIDPADIVQDGRGTGLTDHATMLAIGWLLLAGLLSYAIVPSYTGWAPIAAAWLVALAILGFLRAAIVSWSNAKLQTPPMVPPDLRREAAIGTAIGQLSGAQIAWVFLQFVPSLSIDTQASHFGAWYVNLGLMLFGSMNGLSVALFRYGIRNLTVFSLGVFGLICSISQAFAFVLGGSDQYSPIMIFVGLLPLPLAGVLLGPFFQGAPSQARGIVIAVLLLSLPACAISTLAFLDQFSASMFTWMFPFPLVAAVAATWPLLQRSLTEEPSLANEPADWRSRPASKILWVFSPALLLTSVQYSIARYTLDLSTLVIPLAIALAWYFGLRGFRAALLMTLASCWYYVPVLLSSPPLAPFGFIFPSTSQFELPPWFAPVDLDVAVSALVVAALFARPLLFSRIQTIPRLSWWAIAALGVLLLTQATIPSSIYMIRADDGTARNLCARPEACPYGEAAAIRDSLSVHAFRFGRGSSVPTVEGSANIQESAKATTTNLRKATSVEEQSGSSNKLPRGAADAVALGWIPTTFAILGLFLLFISGIGEQKFVFLPLMAVGIVVSFALDISGTEYPVFGPLSGTTYLGMFTASGIGLYFRYSAITSQRNSALNGVDWTAVAGLVAIAQIARFVDFGSTGGLVTGFTIPPGIRINFSELEPIMAALAALLAWVVGVRITASGSRIASVVISVLLLVPSFLTSLLPLALGAMDTPISLLRPLLPAMLFAIGSFSHITTEDVDVSGAAATTRRQSRLLLALRERAASLSTRILHWLEAQRSLALSWLSRRRELPVPPQTRKPPVPEGAGDKTTPIGDGEPPAKIWRAPSPSASSRELQIPVSPNNPCPFLRALVASGHLDDHAVSLPALSRIVRDASGHNGAVAYLQTFMVGLIANGVDPARIAKNAFSGVELDALRNGPLDKRGVGSRILDVEGRIHEAEIERLAQFGEPCVDPAGGIEIGLTRDLLKTYMAANIERAKDQARWYDSLLMQGEWPPLLAVMGKGEGDRRYLSVQDIWTLFVERRLPDRVIARLSNHDSDPGFLAADP